MYVLIETCQLLKYNIIILLMIGGEFIYDK